MQLKSYTDIEQSKKLAEILPLESADMCYLPTHIGDEHHFIASLSSYSMCTKLTEVSIEYCTPCWSVGALIELMPSGVRISKNCDGNYDLGYRNFDTKEYLYMIDACYELILKLHELKML